MSDEPKGLKFYLCQTPAGPQYVHLQADAKKIDPNFQIVFVDTSKQAIMDRLNHLMRGPIQGISLAEGDAEEPVEISRPAPPPPIMTSRPPAVEARVARMYDQTGFEEFIWDIPDEESYRLNTLEKIIKERRDEIENPGARKPQPAAPTPAGRKQWGNKK